MPSNPKMTPGDKRLPCEKTECTCEEVRCITKEKAFPADGFYIRGSTSPWTDDSFLAKFGECESEMKKEGKDIHKVPCPKSMAKN